MSAPPKFRPGIWATGAWYKEQHAGCRFFVRTEHAGGDRYLTSVYDLQQPESCWSRVDWKWHLGFEAALAGHEVAVGFWTPRGAR